MNGKGGKFEKGSLILLTGATGYVGSHLLKALKADGHRVRCLTRRPETLHDEIEEGVEVVGGDLFDGDSLEKVFEGVHTAYYLVHSMNGKGEFVENDRIAASNFGEAAAKAGVRCIIYLGGLGESEKLSLHLRSRHEVGDILRQSGLTVFEFRASIIIGAGSIPFEIIRSVTERIPFMIASKWSTTDCQPIYIGDVIKYLTAALDKPCASKVYEIGAADTSCYICLMQHYARLRRLPRLTVPAPFLSPHIAAYPLGILAPSLYHVGRWLLEGLNTRTVVKDDSASRDFDIKPLGTVRAMRTAMTDEDWEFDKISWSEKLAGYEKKPWAGLRVGSRYVDTYFTRIPCPPESAFIPIKLIGGDTGWYCGNNLWKIRGVLDELAGGPGFHPHRPDHDYLDPGDEVDAWIVEIYRPNRQLRFLAEMRVPGRAWLDFEVTPDGEGSIIRITAIFDALGFSGMVYWYVVYPFHSYVFRGMLREISNRAAKLCWREQPVPEQGS